MKCLGSEERLVTAFFWIGNSPGERANQPLPAVTGAASPEIPRSVYPQEEVHVKGAACDHVCAVFTINQGYSLLSLASSKDAGRAEPRFQSPVYIIFPKRQVG